MAQPSPYGREINLANVLRHISLDLKIAEKCMFDSLLFRVSQITSTNILKSRCPCESQGSHGIASLSLKNASMDIQVNGDLSASTDEPTGHSNASNEGRIFSVYSLWFHMN